MTTAKASSAGTKQKPRVRRVYGTWVCSDGAIARCGPTPITAYIAWEYSDRVHRIMAREASAATKKARESMRVKTWLDT